MANGCPHAPKCEPPADGGCCERCRERESCQGGAAWIGRDYVREGRTNAVAPDERRAARRTDHGSGDDERRQMLVQHSRQPLRLARQAGDLRREPLGLPSPWRERKNDRRTAGARPLDEVYPEGRSAGPTVVTA
jgi:hypothetical protein